MDRAEKQVELESIVSSFSKAQVAVCADYRGLTGAQVTKLRGELKKAGCEARVVKNTLARLAVNKVAEGGK